MRATNGYRRDSQWAGHPGSTIDRIKAGGKFPHRNDGSIFQNREGLLPKRPDDYYREYVHPTLGVNGAGPQRIVQGQNGELYYTPDYTGRSSHSTEFGLCNRLP